MKFSDVSRLRKHYEAVLEDSQKEIARLQKEIEESKTAIGEANKKAKEAARNADTETYLREKNIVTMHEQRVEMHRVKIIDLRFRHLIDEQEFSRVNREVIELQNELTNKRSEDFMYHISELERIANEQEADMRACDSYANFVQTKVFRMLDSPGDEIQYRGNTGYYGMGNVVRSLIGTNTQWSADMSYIQKAATKALKARTLKRMGGMDSKADQIMKS